MKIVAWLKLHWKGVLIIIGVFLFLLSAVSNCRQNSWYQQIKKEFPGSSVADQADRGLETIAPSS